MENGMCGVEEGDRLRRAVASCARSAVASKAAYMQALEQGTEQALLLRCTNRYALLERLIGLLVEASMGPERVRLLLDGIESDPGRYGSLELALAEAAGADAELVLNLTQALEEGGLEPLVESCFEAALTALDVEEAGSPSPASTALVIRTSLPVPGALLEPKV
jgi:hypothetical protein